MQDDMVVTEDNGNTNGEALISLNAHASPGLGLLLKEVAKGNLKMPTNPGAGLPPYVPPKGKVSVAEALREARGPDT